MAMAMANAKPARGATHGRVEVDSTPNLNPRCKSVTPELTNGNGGMDGRAEGRDLHRLQPFYLVVVVGAVSSVVWGK
jgi:hypothetical protein